MQRTQIFHLENNFERQHIAIIGDGAMTAGMAFEGMNHAGVADADVLIILNDNCMSIDPNAYPLELFFDSNGRCKFGMANTRALLILFFKSSNSLFCFLPQQMLFPLVVMACNGASTMEKLIMNFLKY